jgi:superfamily II DNA/RNA helicase
MFFSATWQEEVRDLAKDILRSRSMMVQVDSANELRANDAVAQSALVVKDFDAKTKVLMEQLRNVGPDLFYGSSVEGTVSPDAKKVMVFCNARSSCDQVYDILLAAGARCVAIHGEYGQEERMQALQDFRDGNARVLVATDLAARGLDIRGVSVVINFEPPHSYKLEEYVHRVGRTGRHGNMGVAVTFLLPTQANQAKAITEVMRRVGQPVSEEVEALAARARGTAKDRKMVKQREYLRQRPASRRPAAACGSGSKAAAKGGVLQEILPDSDDMNWVLKAILVLLPLVLIREFLPRLSMDSFR